MVSIENAVSSALEFATKIYDKSKDELKNLRVEEIELIENEEVWIVTLGWTETAVRQIGGFAGLTNASIEPLPRVYKIFTIDAKNGTVKSMKIRE